MGNVKFDHGSNTAMTGIPSGGGGELLLVTSCNGNWIYTTAEWAIRLKHRLYSTLRFYVIRCGKVKPALCQVIHVFCGSFFPSFYNIKQSGVFLLLLR